MHPAYSVIIFTCASGAGYGLLIWLAIFSQLGWLAPQQQFGSIGIVLALGLITLGLLSSTLHLGHPERAWRAFSQWRTSWLSREGVVAVATYIPAGLLGFSWMSGGSLSAAEPVLAVMTIIGAIVTLHCTAMIYASLRTVPQWNLTLVPLGYLTFGLASGAVLLSLMVQLFGAGAPWAGWLAAVMLLAALAIKAAYWAQVDRLKPLYTAESATGLGHIGKVRALESAHSRPNFVMREMGYVVARKHALRLRGLVLLLAFALPLASSLAAAFGSGGWALGGGFVAAVSLAIGVLIERWLFFAEAQHVVNLYYGAAAA